jgi:hypothetical protein
LHDAGLTNLVLAVFRHTAQDLRYGKTECRNWDYNEQTEQVEPLPSGKSIRVNLKDEANEFLESQWFEDMCGIFKDIEPKKVRKMIRENPVCWRDKYE